MTNYPKWDENIIYDLAIEQAQEATLFYMLKGDNRNDAPMHKEWCKEYLKQQLDYDIYYELEASLEKELNNAFAFTNKNTAEGYIKAELFIDKLPSLSSKLLQQEVDKKILTSPWLSLFTKDNSILSMLMLTGHAVNLGGGLTKNLEQYDKILFDFVKEIWKMAIRELHPFQRGPPHQGTKHCYKVTKNLNSLFNKGQIEIKDNTNDLSENVKAMLSISAALHDIGKADILTPQPPADVHAQSASLVIENRWRDFKLQPLCKNFIGKIIDSHNSEGRGEIIKNTVYNCTIQNFSSAPSYYNIPDDKMKIFCALFQLSDVMDITNERVSTPIKIMLDEIYSSGTGHPLIAAYNKKYKSVEKIINTRKYIKRIYFKPNRVDKIFVKALSSIKPDQYKLLSERIDDENESIKETGAREILEGHLNLPKKLKLKKR